MEKKEKALPCWLLDTIKIILNEVTFTNLTILL